MIQVEINNTQIDNAKDIDVVITMYRNKNNPKPYTITKNRRYKMVTLLKSLKNIYVLMFRIPIAEPIFKSNKHIYKIRY